MGVDTGNGPRIAIVGAGFAGIGAAVTFKRRGLTNFVVLEQSEGPGGVWWDSRYPGAEVDTRSHVYSFSFQRYPWSRSHADRGEVQHYMEHTIDAWDIRSHFRFGVKVDEIRWNSSTSTWHLTTASGTEEFDYVVSAVGLLNVPRFPDWPGLDTFAGQTFHTSQWPEDLDLRGKVVAVAGTGSTSAQVVPQVARLAKKLYVFQREPGWILPKEIETFDERKKAATYRPLRYRVRRWKAFRMLGATRMGGDVYVAGSEANEAEVAKCMAYIEETFADRPDLQKLVTPDYPFWGKRPVMDSNFYRALLRDNVELVPWAVSSLEGTVVHDAGGGARDVDVMVLATGFKPAQILSQLPVYGSSGRSLQEEWGDDPMAFLGVTVPGFPNFFMMYGPNTNGGGVVFLLEQQARFAARSIKLAQRLGARQVDVRPSFYRRYNVWLQKKLRGTVFQTANNYFKSPTGRVVTQWPLTSFDYWFLSRLLWLPSLRLSRESRRQ